ncbi:MAG: diacylglycerol kinase family lipid kinase [Gemmatimonadetes bacterium]|nr:diacylglycerol kinase family lipid kinase [Gemmatimonadota bacterium]
MPIDRFYVVLNPAAGRGAAVRVRGTIEREMARAGAAFAIVETARRGHAAQLAEAAALDGWPAVVAVGGDGTVHEVVNGLMRAANGGQSVPLGIVGVGSGNDFARLVGVPEDPAWAVRRMTEAEPRAVDVGRVGDEWFTNGVGIGLDARVAIQVDRRRRFRGLATYLHALAAVLRVFRPPHMTVEVDGQRVADGPMTLVTVGNGGRHGGGFWICPDARIDDGVLDVCACEGLGTLGILRFLPRVMRGTHTGASCVRMLRGTRVRVTSPDPLPVHADGEIIAEDARELNVELHPGRLRVLA